jgi:redox-sensitive bicupin YhaK (pirin superfamily)
MGILIRKTGDRAYFDYDQLKIFHTFSFGPYEDPNQMGFRSLRVINENQIKPGVGLPLHSQKDMEIFSIVLKGGLAHQDDMGNGSIIRPGYVQLMSAGTGVTHTEINASDKEEVHFLQLWILPESKQLEPSYQEAFFSEETQRNQWGLIISKAGKDGSLKIHQNVEVYLSRLDEGQQLSRSILDTRGGWLQVLKGMIHLNGMPMEAGDGAAISQTPSIEIRADTQAQVLFLDLN